MTTLRSLVVLAFALAFAPSLWAQEAKYELRESVEYGTGGSKPLTLHLALPTGGGDKRPVIVWIHGGGWAAGNKDVHKEAAIKSAERGYVSVSVGYRLAPQGRFPAQIEDVKCCVRWLRAHATELKLDPNRIGAIGFSAGAHLSMMLGVMDKDDGLEGEGGWADQPSKVQAVVAYFGPTNFEAEYPETSRHIVKNFIGGSREEKPEEYRKASPVTYVNAGDAPILIFQGTNDPLVPFEQAWMMTEAMTKAKVPGRIEILINANHGWAGKELERTLNGSFEFFDEHLAKSR